MSSKVDVAEQILASAREEDQEEKVVKEEIIKTKVQPGSEGETLRKVGFNVWIWLVDHPAALIMIVAILIVMLYTYPVQTLIFFITVAFSILMAVLMHKLTNSRMFDTLQLQDLEKTIISGATAGITGFIIGTWAEYNLNRWLL